MNKNGNNILVISNPKDTYKKENCKMIKKTFTAQETIDLTYNYGQSTSSENLNFFMEKAGRKPLLGFTSVFVHSPEQSDANLLINIEAYDDEFDHVTKNNTERTKFVNKTYRYLAKLFPNMTIDIIWYSGFEHHKYERIYTSEQQS